MRVLGKKLRVHNENESSEGGNEIQIENETPNFQAWGRGFPYPVPFITIVRDSSNFHGEKMRVENENESSEGGNEIEIENVTPNYKEQEAMENFVFPDEIKTMLMSKCMNW